MLADWLDSLGSQTATLKCDNEPAIFALAKFIRILRRENSIIIREHPEVGENQNIQLENPEEQHRVEFWDRDWPVSSALITWIMKHAAQLIYMVAADGRHSV